MVEFESDELKRYIEKTLKKEIFNITLDDLKKFEDIGLKKVNFLGVETDYTTTDLILFENLSECSLFKFVIEEIDITSLNKLKNLNYICFEFCDFKVDKLKFNEHINTVCFNMCSNLYLSKLKNITVRKINIIGDKRNKIEMDMSLLENASNLEYLEIHNFTINNLSKILEIAPNLKVINLDGCILENNYEIDMIKSRVKISFEKDFYLTGFVRE